MATVLKRLGQGAPSATTNTTIYTATGGGAVVSTIFACNRSASDTTKFRIAVATTGTPNNEDYIYYDLDIGPNDTFHATVGLTLAAGERIIVYADKTGMSFSAFGQETT